ncbi:MAG: RidA family protein [Chloroflexi bacterium]|nr:RidA family protein [Chloroflexota bacterium]MCZ6867585.1 RidA family protein [Chloroflexota bacterium]
MALERINPSNLAQPRGYTHVVKAGNTVYIAGQVGRRSDGTLAGSDIGSQTDQVFKNLGAALASVGAGFENVTKITVFLTHREDIPGFRTARDKHVTGEPPASTLVLISGLAEPEFRVEVEATAVI